MRIEFINLRSICMQLNNDVEKVKSVVEDLSSILALLDDLQDSCVGLSTKVGSRNYTITKEGDKFVFLETEAI